MDFKERRRLAKAKVEKDGVSKDSKYDDKQTLPPWMRMLET